MQNLPTILIVDDDPDTVESMRLILESRSYRVVTASNAEEGLARVETDAPNLILLDVMMPEGTEGLHFVWKLRGRTDSRRRDIPVLIISAIHQTTELMLYPELGDETYGPGEFLPVQGFIDKPVQPNQLLEKVSALLGE